jgi:hypothetical protein
METLHYRQQKESTPKSPYNLTLGHFEDHGKLILRGHCAQPYTFADGVLADSMHALVNRIRAADPRVRKSIEIKTKDTRHGFSIVLRDSYIGHGVIFTAEPCLDPHSVLRYEGRVQRLSESHEPQDVILPHNGKAAYRSQGKKLVRDLEHYLLG